jgi:hypothetical protein
MPARSPSGTITDVNMVIDGPVWLTESPMRRVRTRRALRGRVIGQSPRPGALRRVGFRVNLLVGRG